MCKLWFINLKVSIWAIWRNWLSERQVQTDSSLDSGKMNCVYIKKEILPVSFSCPAPPPFFLTSVLVSFHLLYFHLETCWKLTEENKYKWVMTLWSAGGWWERDSTWLLKGRTGKPALYFLGACQSWHRLSYWVFTKWIDESMLQNVFNSINLIYILVLELIFDK